jgi:GcrA cell cycle regulator
MEWTAEQIGELRRLWRDGASASTIASRIPGATRAAVCGKARRLRLPERIGGGQRGMPSIAAVMAARYSLTVARARLAAEKARGAGDALRVRKVTLTPLGEQPSPPMELSAWNPLPGMTPMALGDLTSRTCRWPVGHDAPLRYCGCETAPGLVYCPTHARIAFVPPNIRPRAQMARGMSPVSTIDRVREALS